MSENDKNIGEAYSQLLVYAKDLREQIHERKKIEKELKKYQASLEAMVEERTRELQEAQTKLINNAMEAGRAQLSAMILHQIGNAVTPLNILVKEIKNDELDQLSKYFEKIYQNMNDHKLEIDHYINHDLKGKKILSYFGKMISAFKAHIIQKEDMIDKLDRSISTISEYLVIQNFYSANEKELKEQSNLNTIIGHVIQMQSSSIKNENIYIESQLDKNIPNLFIDKSRLMQVITNLIKNSIEALNQLGSSNLKKVICCKTYTDNDSVLFAITDNGVGIESDEIDKVFQFGFSRKGAIGFGLYYCKMFIESNSGTIRIKSEGANKGTTVYIAIKIKNELEI